MTDTINNQGEWRGWADFLGAAPEYWDRSNLLAFLEDLRPYLPELEEDGLYLILQQGGALPAFMKILKQDDVSGVISDLLDNDGQEIEDTLLGTSPEEFGEIPVEESAEAENEPELDEHTPDESELEQESGRGGLSGLATPEALRFADRWAALHYGLDDETAQYLVDSHVAALWESYSEDGAKALDALKGEGGHYFGVIRDRFNAERIGSETLPIPDGWAFKPEGHEGEAPVPPLLMQRRTAYMLSERKRLGNWSGVGSGKTLAGILASRVTNRKHTLVITNNSTVSGWGREILNAFPDSTVRYSVGGPGVSDHLYTVLNYEKFQQRYRRELVDELLEAGVDFVILDEVQFVKQRGDEESKRREAIHALLSELEEQTDLYVLGMSATPVINNLLEARKLLEIVTGKTFADLGTKATVNNALAMRRSLMINGFRYKPSYETDFEVDAPSVTRNDLMDELVQGEGILDLEQTLLPPKLDLIREHIRPGTIIYSQYVDGMIGPIRSYVESLGFTAGLYTGQDKSGLQPFKDGAIDVLIGSKPVGTGLDGLQKVCDQIILVSMPWTSAEYEQIIGRVRRPGSIFAHVSIVVPQVKLDNDGDTWSWDKRRMGTVDYKRTLSDCVLDGLIPKITQISPAELEDEGRKALDAWIERVRGGNGAIGVVRPRITVPLPDAVTDKLVVKVGDFAKLNNRWATSRSTTVKARLDGDPQEWALYHTLYRKARASWDEVPAQRIAKLIGQRPEWRVGDFGAGECLLREALPNNEVISLDYVAFDENVIACDMADAPLDDGSLGAAVFSLSLMGVNWADYLKEANRCLQPMGMLFVAETARKWADVKPLQEAIQAAGFQLLPTEQRSQFIYLRAVKL